MNAVLNSDTIVAISTPPGKGGVGIIRLSGSKAFTIASKITHCSLKNRYAHFCQFFENGEYSPDNILDEGIVIFFQGPHSFTGEDVVELHGHGGPVILDALLKECVKLGARLAKPGEFSERAFLNDKIDLAQAEAIADLIDSSSLQAARNAVRSLQGQFSQNIHTLVNEIINLRMYVEAAIDFPEEEIDFLNDGHAKNQLEHILKKIDIIIHSANQGRILRDGITVVIAGKPNAGKSSLLNMLAGHEAAIVTDIAGTTRDILKEHILIDGMPLHIIDTAGLRESPDQVEKEGIKRASKAITEADIILLVTESTANTTERPETILANFVGTDISDKPITVIRNKCDQRNEEPYIHTENNITEITLSAKLGLGLDLLKTHLKNTAGLQPTNEGSFAARQRHLDALEKARNHLKEGLSQLINNGAGELLAEDLRYCQQALNEVTGEFSNDDLLGKIFSSFCIGK